MTAPLLSPPPPPPRFIARRASSRGRSAPRPSVFVGVVAVFVVSVFLVSVVFVSMTLPLSSTFCVITFPSFSVTTLKVPSLLSITVLPGDTAACCPVIEGRFIDDFGSPSEYCAPKGFCALLWLKNPACDSVPPVPSKGVKPLSPKIVSLT